MKNLTFGNGLAKALVGAVAFLAHQHVHAVPPASASQKPRVIVSQDGEVDDRCSMIRFLMYSSDYDVVGIVENNSIFQKRGHSEEKWLQEEIDLYAKVYPNLKKHHPGFPEAAYLKSVITIGNENSADLQVGPDWIPVEPANMATKDTPGSQLIIDTLLDDDPRVVHVPCWGGANTTAYALWKLKTQHPDQFARAASRIRIYAICYNLTDKAQDGGIPWIVKNMPEVRIFQSAAWSRTWNYSSVGRKSFNPANVQQVMTGDWLNDNVKTGHGPLGEYYPQPYVSEGDTPSFLPLINNGLNQHLDYTLGGWGGRPFFQVGNTMVDGLDGSDEEHPAHRTFSRWIIAAQNDFAARMDWCVATKYADANHNPRALVAGGLVRDVSPGDAVELDASVTTDPDGDALSYRWWQYHEADSAESIVMIRNGSSERAGFVVPDEPGKQIQIVLEATDNGDPPLVGYQRVLLNISRNTSNSPE